MIVNVRTGERLATVILPVGQDELRPRGSDWRFDWRSTMKTSEVYRLVEPARSDVTLGLIGLRKFPDQFVEVDLLEVNSRDVGFQKEWDGIAGSLLAFAALQSFRIGGEGYVAIYAKTELLDHYETKYGFQRVRK